MMTTAKPNSHCDNLTRHLESIEHLLSTGNTDEAASLSIALTKSHPQKSATWLWLSRVSLALNKIKLAIDSALKAIETDATLAINFTQLAKCYLSVHEWKNARKAANYALELLPPKNVDVIIDLATILFDTGEFNHALELYNHALSLDSHHRQALHNRALLNRFNGNFPGAEKDYQQLLSIQPDDYESFYKLSQIKVWHQPNNRWLTQLEESAFSKLPWKSQAYVEFATGKFLEDQQRYQEAFIHYTNGNNLIHSNVVIDGHYSLNEDLAIHNTLPQQFSKRPSNNHHTRNADIHRSETDSWNTPLFILGMPRTGSTLIERILSNHSLVISGGELTSLPLAIMESVGLTALHDPFSMTLDHLQPPCDKKKASIKRRYQQLTHDKINTKRQHRYIIDKLPFNYKFIGHIVSVYPHAKIIYTDRNLMDTIISNYRMLFNHGYPYCYDLDSLHRYTKSFKNMMSQWQERFPNNIYKLSYETLINQPQPTITAVLNFCNLPTENTCFEFHKNPTPSQTASASQIRQPLHDQSINSWKNYQPYLDDLIEEFEQH